MPNPKLSDKFRGKPFGEISKEIESKYKDRFDPISKRGLMAEMSSLKEEQEFQRAKQETRQQLEQQLQQVQQMEQMQQQGQMPGQMDQQQMNPMAPEIQASNMGVAPQMPEQDMGNFQHAASQTYNQQFAYGGQMQYPFGGEFDPINRPPLPQTPLTVPNIDGIRKGVEASFKQGTTNVPGSGGGNTGFGGENINLLRYAPLAANLFGILSARRAPSTQSTLGRMGMRTQVDESLASGVTPRQTQFGNVDMSQIERGITDQARSFTGANVNMSGGQSGQFMANELANQANVMNAISQARMGAQQQDRQTQAMNAQEQARIDAFRQQQGMQRAGIQGQNIGLGMQMADLDVRNEGAFVSNRMSGIQALGQNIGNIGKQSDQMKMVANALGYNSFGEYVQSLPPDQRGNAMKGFLEMIGGMFNRG